jgi:hypothetical protein
MPGQSFSISAAVNGSDWDPSSRVAYQWECSLDGGVLATNGPCDIELGNTAFNVISADALSPGNYSFTVTASQAALPPQRATTTVVVNAPPVGGVINVACYAQACGFPDRPVNPAQSLRLKVQAT